MPNNAAFVDRDGHRHHVKSEKVERIDKDRPTELPPLGIESRALRMLFLHDAHDHQFAGIDEGLDGFLPHGQHTAAPGSPRREMDEQHFFTAIVRQSPELPIQLGQEEIGVDLSYPCADHRRGVAATLARRKKHQHQKNAGNRTTDDSMRGIHHVQYS